MSTQDPVEIVNAFKDSNYFFLHGESIGTAFHAVIGIIGLLLMPLVVVAILKELKKTPSAPIILSLCMGDTFYLVNSVIFGIANTATGRWYFGFTGCVVNHVVVIAACFISVMSLIALTLERYLGVVHRTPLTVQHTLIMAAVIWFVAITVAFWPLYTLSTDYGIMLSVGKVICSFNWTTRGRAMLLTPIIMCVVTLVVGLVFIAFGYYQIVSLYFTVKKNLHKVIGNDTVAQAVMDKSTSSAPKKEYTEADKRLLYKAIALTVSFIICWSPYFLLIVIELVSNEHVSIWYDALSCCCGLGCSAVSPYLLFYFDARIRRTVLEILGMDHLEIFKLSSKQDSSNASKSVVKSISSQNGNKLLSPPQ